jgi:hypothetical protein
VKFDSDSALPYFGIFVFLYFYASPHQQQPVPRLHNPKFDLIIPIFDREQEQSVFINQEPILDAYHRQFPHQKISTIFDFRNNIDIAGDLLTLQSKEAFL